MERIDKVISVLMCISRSDSRRLIRIGKVLINGEKVKKFEYKVDENVKITVNGIELKQQKNVFIILNKPKGVVCDDKSKDQYAVDILPEELKRKDLFCVGRLDKDTEGLIIITNNGDYSHNVISPKKHIEKCYYTKLAEPLTDKGKAMLETGVTLSDGTKLLPARIEFANDNKTDVLIYITEGKYHQIKRMAGAVENKVTYLKRISIGNLVLNDNLKLGESTEISEEEANLVFENS